MRGPRRDDLPEKRLLCATCHWSRGTGVASLLPDLAASNSVASREPTSLLRVVLRGTQSVATDSAPTGPALPAFGWQLSDAEVAAVLTCIRNSWGHAAPAVGERSVRNARAWLTARNDEERATPWVGAARRRNRQRLSQVRQE
jgi:mono/diheme cytochrome c family protein